MNCLTNRIGIQGCDAPASAAVPASAPGVIPATAAVDALPILLVNDLPGISFENINALTSDEQVSYLDVWNRVVLRTMKKFEGHVKRQLNRCYQITDNTIVECLVCERKDLFDVALLYLHGVELMIERTSSDEVNRFTTIDYDKAERLKTEFFDEFSDALSDAVKSLNPSDSACIDTCIECNDVLQWRYQLP